MYNNNNEKVSKRIDLEYGSVYLSKNINKAIDFYNTNKKTIFLVLLSFFVISISILIKFSFNNIDRLPNVSYITLDEEPFKPFDVIDTLIVKADKISTKQFPIKTSIINIKLQSMNLISVQNKIRRFLQQTNNVCVHARHFSSEYDILVFNNLTIINAEIVGMSEVKKNVKEMNLVGETNYAKRSVMLTINYIDTSLEKKVKYELYGHQAMCFQYYMI